MGTSTQVVVQYIDQRAELKLIKMCDEDVAALVVDNGSGMCKAGFAGGRSQSCLPIHCWSSPPPGSDGWYGTEGLLCWRRGPVQERYPHPEVPHRARNHHQLG